MNIESFEVRVKLEGHDIGNYNFYYSMNSLNKIYMKYKVFIGLAVLGFIASGLVVLANGGSLESPLPKKAFQLFGILTGVLLFFGVLALTKILSSYSMRRASKRYFKGDKLPPEQMFSFSGDGMEITEGENKVKLPWEKINRIEKFKTHYGVFISKDQAYIIPIRSLAEQYVLRQMQNLQQIGMQAEK